MTKLNAKNIGGKIKKKHILMIVAFFVGVVFIVSSYAWFSTALNVKVKNFNMIVSKNSGLSISFDGITYDSYVEISEDMLINKIRKTYPTNTSQWPALGLVPVSTNGIKTNNNDKYDVFAGGGVSYKNRKRDNGFVMTSLVNEDKINDLSYYIAFDIFLKNVTGSPVDDNLFLDYGTSITMDSEATDEMLGLVNSMRIGFVKIGSVPLTAKVNDIQGIKCNNNCKTVIYEPNSTSHSDLSIERAKKYNLDLIDGQFFPTYAWLKNGGPIEIKNTISGSGLLNPEYFALQNTITEADFRKPIFEIPNGITKFRIYVWVEGQDIDSLETDSQGADISISIDLTKDTKGYDYFN